MIARFVQGPNSFDLTSGAYSLGSDFLPPSTQYDVDYAYGTSANTYGGAKRNRRKARPNELTFSVRILATGQESVMQAAQSLNSFINRYNGKPAMYFEYSASELPEPVYGQLGARRTYEVLSGFALLGGETYKDRNLRAAGLVVLITLTLSPFATGIKQRLCNAKGGVFEDVLGMPAGRSRGTNIPKSTTCKIPNSAFADATWNAGWTAAANLIASKNMDLRYCYPGSRASALITSRGNINNTYTQTVNVGNVNKHSLSAIVARRDGGAVTTADCVLWYGSAQTTTIRPRGFGVYELFCDNINGIAADTTFGISVPLGRAVYLMAAQIEESVWHTPIAHAGLLGCIETTSTVSSGGGAVPTPAAAAKVAVNVTGTTYYVDGDAGNDNNSGLSTGAAFKTLAKGVTMLAAGNAIRVKAKANGTAYTINNISITASGSAVNYGYILPYVGGTMPIIDGTGSTIGQYNPFVNLYGNYLYIGGFEIRNSPGMGVQLAGNHNVIADCKVHDAQSNGVFGSGDYSIIEYNQVYRTCMLNENYKSSTWPSACTAARDTTGGDNITQGAIIRYNEVWDNWGEGVSTYESDHVAMYGNSTHNNFSANLYISDTAVTTAYSNFVYMDPSDSYINNTTAGSHVGIMCGSETHLPALTDITIVNNIVVNTNRNFYWWINVAGDHMINYLIANNIFMDGPSWSVQISQAAHTGSSFINNIVIQSDAAQEIAILSTNITYSNNSWSKAPPAAGVGAGDSVGDVKLVKTGLPYADPHTTDYYRLQATSPAINAGTACASAAVDFNRVTRTDCDANIDMGPIEYYNPDPEVITTTITGATRSAGVMKLDVDASILSPDFWTLHLVWIPDTPSTVLTSGTRYLFTCGAGNLMGYIDYADNKYVKLSDGSTIVSAASLSWSAGDVIDLYFSGGEGHYGISYFINASGESSVSSANYAPPPQPTALYIGSDHAGANQTGGTYACVGLYGQHNYIETNQTYHSMITSLLTGAQRVDYLPYLWTVDGDGALDNCDDGAHKNWGVVAGIPGDVPAITEITGAYGGGATFPGAYLSNYALDFFYAPTRLYSDFSGTTDATYSGGAYRSVTLTTTGQTAVNVYDNPIELPMYLMEYFGAKKFYLFGRVKSIKDATYTSLDKATWQVVNAPAFPNPINQILYTGELPEYEAMRINRDPAGANYTIDLYMKNVAAGTIQFDFMALLLDPVLLLEASANTTGSIELNYFANLSDRILTYYDPALHIQAAGKVRGSRSIEFEPGKYNHLVSLITNQTSDAIAWTNTLSAVDITPRWSLIA